MRDLARRNEPHEEHHVHQHEEARADEMVFAEVADRIREDEVPGRYRHDAARKPDYRRAFLGAFGDEPHEHHGEDRDEVNGVHLLQVAEDGGQAREHRRDAHRRHRDHEAEPFAGVHAAAVVGFREELFVDAEREHRAGRVQGGVETGEHRAGHHRREKARKPRRKDGAHQFAVGVRFAQLHRAADDLRHGLGRRRDGAVPEEEERHDAGQHEVERADEFQESAEQHALLPFLEGRSREGALDDLLVRAPVEDVDEDDAREDLQERRLRHELPGRRLRRTDGVEVSGDVGSEVAKAAEDRAGAFRAGRGVNRAARPEAEKRDHEAAQKEPDAVQQVGDDNRLEAAEKRVNRADYADEPHERPQQRGVALDPGHGLEVEDAAHARRSGVEDHRQQDEHVGEHEKEVAKHLRLAAETDVQQFRHGRDAAFEELRQEKQRHEHDRYDAHDFPHHHRQPRRVALAVQAHELLRGEVRQEQRRRDERKRERPPGKEKAVVRAGIPSPAFPPRDHGDKRGEKHERTQCERNIHGCRFSFVVTNRRRGFPAGNAHFTATAPAGQPPIWPQACLEVESYHGTISASWPFAEKGAGEFAFARCCRSARPWRTPPASA